MVLPYINTFEHLSSGGSINTGGGGNTGFGTVQQTWTAETTAARTGTLGAQSTLGTTAGYARGDVVGATGRQMARMEFYYPGAPTSAATIIIGRNSDSSEVGTCAVQIQSSGIPRMLRTNSGTGITESAPGASPFTGAGWYAVEVYHDPTGASNLANLGYRIIDVADESVLFEWTSESTYDVGTNGATTRWRFGAVSSSQWGAATFRMDNLQWGPQASGWVGPIPEAPDLDLEDLGPFHVWRASEVDGGTFTVDHLTGPDNSLGLIEFSIGGKAYFALPRGASTSTYDLEVSTSGGATNETLVVPASASGLVSGSVRRRVWNGSELL